jgi:hypothetical protein
LITCLILFLRSRTDGTRDGERLAFIFRGKQTKLEIECTNFFRNFKWYVIEGRVAVS